MTDQATNEPVRQAPKRDWVEIVATVLLALAAVATAWSSYQSTRWNGEQTKASSRTNAIRIEATRAASLAEAETEIDVATFVQWIDAHATRDTALEDFYRKRFRPEFKPAFNAWDRDQAVHQPGRPDDPVRDAAVPVGRDGRGRAARPGGRSFVGGGSAQPQHAANYVLGVVLFAVALFFAGMSTKLHTPGLRKAMLVVGCVLFVGTAAWIATFPVSVSI
jgi:type II secretory pathway pseudopilin PulG